MEDVWRLAAAVFQVWMFVVLFLIMLPAMFGLSLGVTGVYIQILVKILEVTDSQFSLYLISVYSEVTCSCRHGVRGHLKITVSIVGNAADPERTAAAAQRAGSSAQR